MQTRKGNMQTNKNLKQNYACCVVKSAQGDKSKKQKAT